MDKAIVIDGHSLIYRMYFAAVAVNKKNPSIDIKRQTLKLIYSVCFKLAWNYSKYLVIAFDGPRKELKRVQEFASYKANRKPMPDTLRDMQNEIKTIFDNFGFVIISKVGIEADDLIGSFCNLASSKNIDCEVYTSDHDLLQLLQDHVYVNLFTKGISETENFDAIKFKEKYGFDAKALPDFKGLAGDGSDNYPGINGIGKKTAENLLRQFGNINNIYANIKDIKQTKIKNMLIEHQNECFMFKDLATINTSLFLNQSVELFLSRDKKIQALKSDLLELNFEAFLKYFEN